MKPPLSWKISGCVPVEILWKTDTAMTIITVWYNVVSPNFLMWIFCEKAQFLQNRPKLCNTCVFPHNFHIRKLGEILVLYTVDILVDCFNQQFLKSFFTITTKWRCACQLLQFCIIAWSANTLIDNNTAGISNKKEFLCCHFLNDLMREKSKQLNLTSRAPKESGLVTKE